MGIGDLLTQTEDTLDKILRISTSKFDIFHSSPITESENIQYVEWSTDHIEDFLEFAEKIGIKVIYLHEGKIVTDSEDEHNGELGYIEVGFLYGGIFHVFSEGENWFFEEETNEEAPEIDVFGHKIDTTESLKRKTSIKELDEKPPNELAKEIVEFAYKEFSDSLTSFYKVADAFWESKGLNFIGADAKNRIKMERVNQIAEKEVMNALVNKEKEQLPQIIEDCISWAKENRFNKLTRANMQAFLLEKRLDITYFTQDALYVRVNFELKKKKYD